MPVPNSTAVAAQFAGVSVPGPLYQILDPSDLDASWWDCTEPPSVYISKGPMNEPIVFVFTPLAGLDIPPSSTYEIIQNWTVNMEDGAEYLVDGLLVRFQIDLDGTARVHSLLRDIEEIYALNPDATADDAVQCVIDNLSTNIPRGDLLDDGEIKGLYGELSLIERMLGLAAAHEPVISPIIVLDAWKGYVSPGPMISFGARRDFKRPGRIQVIEVKATGNDLREHHISNWQQLIPEAGEELYLYSVSTKIDASGTETLPGIINRVHAMLGGAVQEQRFMEYLSQYGTGYWPQHDAHYGLLPLLIDTFSSEMFQASELDYLMNDPHANSHSYSYTLDLEAEDPMTSEGAEAVIIAMLT